MYSYHIQRHRETMYRIADGDVFHDKVLIICMFSIEAFLVDARYGQLKVPRMGIYGWVFSGVYKL